MSKASILEAWTARLGTISVMVGGIGIALSLTTPSLRSISAIALTGGSLLIVCSFVLFQTQLRD